MSERTLVQPQFVRGTAGDLFLLTVRPVAESSATVLMVPPFAEEANRVRRTIFLQARELAHSGIRVLVPDHYGTGDSQGDFSEASWDIWRSDLRMLLRDLENFDGPAYAIAIRLSALLLLDSLTDVETKLQRIVFWQPVTSGSTFIKQFLRLRTLSGTLSGAVTRETVASLEARLADGELLEVAGYPLTPELARAVYSLDFRRTTPPESARILWIDSVARENAESSFQSKKVVGELTDAGWKIEHRTVQAPQYWATPEITIAENVIAATSQAIHRG